MYTKRKLARTKSNYTKSRRSWPTHHNATSRRRAAGLSKFGVRAYQAHQPLRQLAGKLAAQRPSSASTLTGTIERGSWD